MQTQPKGRMPFINSLQRPIWISASEWFFAYPEQRRPCISNSRTNHKIGGNEMIGMDWKKKVATTLALTSALLLGACAGGTEEATDSSAASSTASADAVHIGILQILEHESLSAARTGFLEVLEEAGYVEGDNLIVDYQNAQGDQANLQSMAERLAGNNDLILSISTPASQAVANAEKENPVLFTAVTDPIDAGLVASAEEPGANITGTSDQSPMDKQIELLLSIVPGAETVGIIYNSSEMNSIVQSDQAQTLLEAAGVNVEIMTVTSTNDVQQVMESLVQKVDAIYIPTDNTLSSTMATVGQIAMEAKIPVIPGATEMVEAGGLATYGIDFKELGRQTGEMALQILEEGKLPSELPVQFPKTLQLVVNEEMAEALGIDPDSIKLPE